MAESIHKKLDRVRRPRVHITYDVHIGDAMVKRELPFVVGVMGDYSGNAPTQDKKRLDDRKFVNIDRDNFNDIMARIGPGAQFRAENTLTGEGEVGVQLKFNSMDDFDPEKVVAQIPALQKLLETRNKIRDLLSTIDRSANLEEVLEGVLQDPDKIKKLAQELGYQASAAAANDGEKS
jgi:type VI secretion system protein ImpB